MDVLIRYGFSIEEIKNMMDTNDSIDQVFDKDIYELIEILQKVGCDDKQIKNIFLCNPFYLTCKVFDVHNLIKKLYEIGCSSLSLLFDSNPYLLNMKDEELEMIYHQKIHEGFCREEIIDYIQYNILF